MPERALSGSWMSRRARDTLVAFRSTVLHRVTPITRGLRKPLVDLGEGAGVSLAG